MKYYLVARTTCVMVGIEQCRGFIVGRSLRAAFEREYAGRILMVTSGALAWPGISYLAYKKASGPFYYCYRCIEQVANKYPATYPPNPTDPINRGTDNPPDPFNPLIRDNKRPRSFERGHFIGIWYLYRR